MFVSPVAKEEKNFQDFYPKDATLMGVSYLCLTNIFYYCTGRYQSRNKKLEIQQKQIINDTARDNVEVVEILQKVNTQP